MDHARESSEAHRAEQVENEDVHDVLADDEGGPVPDADRDVDDALGDQHGPVPDADRPVGGDPQELQGDDPASGGS